MTTIRSTLVANHDPILFSFHILNYLTVYSKIFFIMNIMRHELMNFQLLKLCNLNFIRHLPVMKEASQQF